MHLDDPLFAARVLGGLTSGIVGIDSAGTVVLLNDGAWRLLAPTGGRFADAMGRDCREVLCGQPKVARLLLDCLEGRDPLSRAELALDGSGGCSGPTIGLTLAAVRDESGAVCGATMLFRDLTPFERSDEQERLRDRLAALGEMAAGLAHEIRNPLAGMELLAGLLHRRLAGRPDVQALVSDLLEQQRRLATTVDESLDFVRPVALARDRFDPQTLFEAALERALLRAPQPVSVERRYENGLPQILVDADLIGASLTNLIVNACEAMADGVPERASSLVLGLRACTADRADPRAASVCGREVVFSIADSGSGIPPELFEKVFYPFFTTKPQGSGIGLANVQKIVLGHSGRVTFECPPDGGCTFFVHLPVELDAGPVSLSHAEIANARSVGRADA